MRFITLRISNPQSIPRKHRRQNMRISYNKLWKMLIDKNMNKQDLAEKSGISSASIAKLGKGGNITTDILLKICEALDCKLEDIMETVKEQK
jgi:putative transcriptional regulator